MIHKDTSTLCPEMSAGSLTWTRGQGPNLGAPGTGPVQSPSLWHGQQLQGLLLHCFCWIHFHQSRQEASGCVFCFLFWSLFVCLFVFVFIFGFFFPWPGGFWPANPFRGFLVFFPWTVLVLFFLWSEERPWPVQTPEKTAKKGTLKSTNFTCREEKSHTRNPRGSQVASQTLFSPLPRDK